MSTPTDNTLWSQTMGGMRGALTDSVNEIYRLIPDSILFGSLLLFFLTQNLAFGVFGIFIFETVMSHKLLSWLFSQAVGPLSRPLTMANLHCRSGYKTPQFKMERMFNHDNYPSYGVYSIASIGTYLWLATKEFAGTLDSMGAEWSSRSTVAYSLIGIVTLLIVLVRWATASCQESFAELMFAVVLAVITGVVFFFLNKAIFGAEGMNFLGLPYLVSKESQGSPIYVCSIEQGEESKSSA